MRKAHYSILANILRRHFESVHHSSHYQPETREIVQMKLDSIADCFARECGLDRDAFLVACGMLKR